MALNRKVTISWLHDGQFGAHDGLPRRTSDARLAVVGQRFVSARQSEIRAVAARQT
jgi:hypothetical protein